MRRAEAASQLRQWFAVYASTVDGALRRFGIADREERANLTQDVLLAGYHALERGEVIENPRAWLYEYARKYASNYRRKAQRQMVTDDRPIVSAVPTPEQIVEQRELADRSRSSAQPFHHHASSRVPEGLEHAIERGALLKHRLKYNARLRLASRVFRAESSRLHSGASGPAVRYQKPARFIHPPVARRSHG